MEEKNISNKEENIEKAELEEGTVESDYEYSDSDDNESFSDDENEEEEEEEREEEEENGESGTRRRRKEKKKTPPKKKGHILHYIGKFFFSLVMISLVLGGGKNKISRASFGQEKILSPQETVDQFIVNIDYYSKNTRENVVSMHAALTDLGRYLNHSVLSNYVVASFKETDFASRLQQIAKSLAYSCESLFNTCILEDIYLLLHDYVIKDHSVRVNKEAARAILSNCDMSIPVINALFSFLTAETQTEDGRDSLRGIGPALSEFAESQDFGVPAFNTLCVYCFLVDQENLTATDGKALARFVSFATDNQDKWSSRFRTAYIQHQSQFAQYEPKMMI